MVKQWRSSISHYAYPETIGVYAAQVLNIISDCIYKSIKEKIECQILKDCRREYSG